MKNKIILIVFAFATLFAADNASAYYNPSTGQWLSRDPIGEPGFELLRDSNAAQQVGQVESGASLPPSRLFIRDSIAERKGPNRYAFAGNNAISKIDRLGLDITSMPGIPHVSNDRDHNYLIFYISCPSGFKVSNVQVHYDETKMWSEMYQWYVGQTSYTDDLQEYIDSVTEGLTLRHGSTGFGGLQGPPLYRPIPNCLGQPVEEHAYMRTRLVAPGGEFWLFRKLWMTPDPNDMIGIYQENTVLTWVCSSCCGRGKSK